MKDEPPVWPSDVHGTIKNPPKYKPVSCSACAGTGLEDCATCDGTGSVSCRVESCDGLHDCGECRATGFQSCLICDGRGTMGAQAIIATEANRLWKRDIGRGVTTGTRDLYIGFAKAAYAAGELTPKEQAA